jgi:SpoIIAA-like
MFQILDSQSDKVLCLKVSGKLMHQDYQQIIPQLEALIAEHGSIRCLLELTEFEGLQLRALWDEIKFDTKHCRNIERCAIVGGSMFVEFMTKLSKPLFRNAQVKCFDAKNIGAAREYIYQSLPETVDIA